MRKALSNAGITIERSPNVQKPREQTVIGKQKNKILGAAKKSKANTIAQRSLVPAEKTELSDSDDDNQPEYGAMMAVAVKAQEACKPPIDQCYDGWNYTPKS